MTITINGPLTHSITIGSGWQYVQVILGGESFVGLSQGLQKIHASGGAPQTHRTDSLSAAYETQVARPKVDSAVRDDLRPLEITSELVTRIPWLLQTQTLSGSLSTRQLNLRL